MRTQQNVNKIDWKVVMNRDDKLLQFNEQVLNLKTVLSCVLLQLSTGEQAGNKIKFIQKCSSVSLFRLKKKIDQNFPFLTTAKSDYL